MNLKTVLMDKDAMKRALTRISHEIIEKNKGTNDLILVGVRRRGVPLAGRIAEIIRNIEGTDVQVGSVDITLYRDDLSTEIDYPTAKSSDIGVDVKGKKVIIIDDVLYTGRTARAAIDAIIHEARPQMIQLAVLVDRGHRELPIRPDYVGKNIPTSKEELVSVELEEIDQADAVKLFQI